MRTALAYLGASNAHSPVRKVRWDMAREHDETMDCDECGGTGECIACEKGIMDLGYPDGAEFYGMPEAAGMDMGDHVPCSNCGATGRCPACGGTGIVPWHET